MKQPPTKTEKQLIKAIKSAGLSQNELARISGVDQGTLSRFLTDDVRERRSLSLATADRLCRVLQGASCEAGALDEPDYVTKVRASGLEQDVVEYRAAVADAGCCSDWAARDDGQSAESPSWRAQSVRVSAAEPPERASSESRRPTGGRRRRIVCWGPRAGTRRRRARSLGGPV